MDNFRKTPVVFVSSTCYDLKQIREDIKEFFEKNYGFEAMLSEFDSFPIDPCKGTFENCLNNVDKYADMFVLIVGTRYGYVTDKGKSITNLEYLHAKAKGIPMFIFVSKQINNNLSFWKNNKEADFSSVVDNPKIFEFVSEIYDESHQWIYTYENVRDITMTMKNQLRLLFSDGLIYQKLVSKPENAILKSDIPVEAKRTVIEKPFAWEYKFLAYLLKDEFDKLQRRKWDFQYGIFEGHTVAQEPIEFLNDTSQKLDEMVKLMHVLEVILNSAVQEAIGDPGVPSNLEMMVYVAKRFASIYERLIAWALYFKSIQVDETFEHLQDLLYSLPKSALATMDAFVNRLYSEIIALPDVDDGVKHEITLTCTLDAANTGEICEEIERINTLLHL